MTNNVGTHWDYSAHLHVIASGLVGLILITGLNLIVIVRRLGEEEN